MERKVESGRGLRKQGERQRDVEAVGKKRETKVSKEKWREGRRDRTGEVETNLKSVRNTRTKRGRERDRTQ